MLIIWVASMLLPKLCPIEHVYDDGISVDNNMYKTYEKWIDKNKIQRSTLRSGDVVDFGHGAVFVVYAPWTEPLTDKKERQILIITLS